MSEVGVEIVKTEEAEENEIKYLNINVSNSEVERKPDIVRLCADSGILEYVNPKTGHCKDCKNFREIPYHIDICNQHTELCPKGDWYCADFEPQESEG